MVGLYDRDVCEPVDAFVIMLDSAPASMLAAIQSRILTHQALHTLITGLQINGRVIDQIYGWTVASAYAVASHEATHFHLGCFH